METKKISLEMKNYLTAKEKILWYDRPKKSAYIVGASIKMAPIAILWLLIDGFFISTFFTSGSNTQMGNMGLFLIPFFALHLMPVWIWLYTIFKANVNHKYLEYCLTDQRLIIKNDVGGISYKNVFLNDIQNVNLSFSPFDKSLHVGDIVITDKSQKEYKIYDISSYQEIFKILNDTEMQNVENQKFCEYCGAKILDGSPTCVNCGAKIK